MTTSGSIGRAVAALCLAVTTIGAAAFAQEEVKSLTNVAARDARDLSGTWTYSIDPYADGVAGFHGSAAGFGHRRYEDLDVDAFLRENPAALIEYDMRQSPEATLPGSWTGHAPEMRHYEGLVWYQRLFDASPQEGTRTLLHFGAVNYAADVYLNGETVGRHEGGFTPFVFDVTDIVRNGENVLVVGVDSERDAASVPPLVTDWETYGGITRPVRLVTVPETFIEDAWVRLSPSGETIDATVRLNGPDADAQSVRVTIEGVETTLAGETGADGLWQGSIRAPEDLPLWSPDTPTLRDVTIASGADTLAERIGFRTLSLKGEQLLLNGEPIFLRGICMHEEALGTDPDRSITEEDAKALLSEIKNGLNGNFVRLAHYPHSEVTTRMADEMGLLVWSEIPVYWRIDWENAETLAAARRMLEEMILRDRNRASIALWSIGNETPKGDARLAFMERLAADVRDLDETRLVTAALLTGMTEEDGIRIARIDDPLAESLDVLAVNTYNGWYGGMPLDEVSAVEWRSTIGKPMILSEFGAGALQGFRDRRLKRKFSETYQADYYRATLAMAAEIPFLVGTSPWLLKDFRSPRRQHPVYQEGWNRKGLLSETGERKPAFNVLADWYADRTEDR